MFLTSIEGSQELPSLCVAPSVTKCGLCNSSVIFTFHKRDSLHLLELHRGFQLPSSSPFSGPHFQSVGQNAHGSTPIRTMNDGDWTSQDSVGQLQEPH